MKRNDTLLNTLIFASTMSATIMAAFAGSRTLVPIAVALGSSFHTFVADCNFQQELAALNNAIATLVGCLTFWDSLSIVDRRIPETREHIVQSTEDAVLMVVSAGCGFTSGDHAQESHGRHQHPVARGKDKKKKQP